MGRRQSYVLSRTIGRRGVYAFDTTNPLAPTLDSSLSLSLGMLATPALISSVENEETATNGKVLILSSTALQEAVVLDVSNPKAMKEIGGHPASAWPYADVPRRLCLGLWVGAELHTRRHDDADNH